MFEPQKRPYGLPVLPDGQMVQVAPVGYTMPPPGYHPADMAAEERFNPLKLFWYVIHHRWLIAAFLTAGLVAGILVTFLQTPMYRATAKIEILTSGAKVLQDLEVLSQSNDFRVFETAKLKMESRDLARRVVFELNLARDRKFLAPAPSFSLVNLFTRITGRNRTADLDALTTEQRERMAVGLVQSNLSVTLLRNTSVLSVGYAHPLPQYAESVANQTVRSFIDQNIDKTSETSDLARQFIEVQVNETKQKLQQSEKALIDYAKREGITITGTDASLIGANLSQLNEALAEAIQERLAAERYYEQVEDGDAATLPEVFQSSSIQETKQRIAELRATYQEKLNTLKPGFPEMQRLSAQITELQKQIDLEVAAIGKSMQIRYEQTKLKEEALRDELAGLENEQREFQDKNIQYTILKREVDSNRTQYENLISKLNEVGVGAELKSKNASIVDFAVLPGAPYSPRLLVNALLSLAIFGALAVAVIYLLELMNNYFSVPDQIESELGISVLGIIPKTDEADLIENSGDKKTAVSEAYQSLRTSLQFTGTENEMRTLLVTSSEPSEGKSSTVFKLAQDFAALGRQVLVIDADMRKPRLHRVFNTDNSTGLSNLLSNVTQEAEVMSIFRNTRFPNVKFLAAGTIPPNPVDLLMSQRMSLTLHFCAKKYDLVIIDSPPVMGLSDAPILSRQADATLLVVSSKQVTRKAAKSALSRLKAAGGNVVGATLTKFEVGNLDYNYAYRYMQYNYYGGDEAEGLLENHAVQSKSRRSPDGQLSHLVAGVLDRLRRRAS